MATRRFFNKFNNVYCDVCGKLIPVGEPDGEMKWSRRGTSKGKKWHVLCDGSKLESEIETQDTNSTNGFAEAEALKDAFAKTLEGGSTTLEDTLGIATKTAKETAKEETKAKTNGASADWLTGFAGAIFPLLEDKLNAKLDRSQVEGIVKEMIGGAVLLTTTQVKVEKVETGEVKDMGIQHKSFPTLLQVCNTRINCWLTGPAGSGKTTACSKVAEALNLQFFHIGAMDNEYKLLGFIDAKGEVVNTQFKDWYRNGGVLCMDEIDSWLPAATLALNAALDNGHCAFPDGMMQRHPDAIAVACANTWGLGATNDYCGRMKQDAAFLERFPVQLDWQYDEALELMIAGNAPWVKRVQHLRARARAKGLKVIISPRASKYGAKLLAAGMAQERVEQLTVRKAMTDEQWNSIQ